jgi:DNA end-binding protein Ku
VTPPKRSAVSVTIESRDLVPREETVKGYETAKDEYVRFEPEELKALEQTSSSALVIDSFVPEGAIDPVYFEDTYYLGAGKNGERGYRVLTEALGKTHRVAVGTFTWRGKTTPIAIRRHQSGLLLQRLYFADEVYNAAEIDRGADPKIRDQERTLAERLITELSATEIISENYEDEYRKRVLKAIEQKIAGLEIERVEVEARPPTTDLVAMLKVSLGRKELAKAPATKSVREAAPEKRPAMRRLGVVVGKPAVQLREHGFRVAGPRPTDVVPLEGLHEGFGDGVTFGTVRGGGSARARVRARPGCSATTGSGSRS